MEMNHMIKKLMLAVATLVATMGFAFAQVDVNKADAAALDSVKGLGPASTKLILDERAKGEFKDWADFQKRVKGVGDKRAAKLSAAGLQVSGKPLAGAEMAPAKPADAKTAKHADARPAKPADTKDAKAAKGAEKAKPADAKTSM
jgi:competence protein ComEA